MKKGMILFTFILGSVLFMTACQGSTVDQNEQQALASTGYPSGEIQQPQMMYRDQIYYYQAAGFDESLPSGYACVGSVSQVDNLSAPMENFCGSRVEIGQKIFASESDPDTIYIQYETGYARFSIKEVPQPQ